MNKSKKKEIVLIADDDATIRVNLALLLRSEGFEILEARDGEEAAYHLNQSNVSAALLDLKMPKKDGMAILREFADRLEETPVIVVTAFGGSAAAIQAMKLGAYDYITKPFDLDEILFTIRRALTQRALIEQVEILSAQEQENIDEEELIGRSQPMMQIFKTIGRVAPLLEPVLITGESGTGKELIANAIHRNSERAGMPFIKVNSAALSGQLLESELFGHERGAFTGAIASRRGRFELAHQGTLFLDEIGEMEMELQAKLLRVLQYGTFERLGGDKTCKVDVRVIAATNRQLNKQIADGKFREDLYYRLNVVSIHLPPLRERLEDIPILVEHLLRQIGKRYHWPHLTASEEVLDWLSKQYWPGNVRELRNFLARASILARGHVIQVNHLEQQSISLGNAEGVDLEKDTFNLRELLATTEKRIIARALEHEKWNRTQTARLLGISRRQLFDKIRIYDLHEPN